MKKLIKILPILMVVVTIMMTCAPVLATGGIDVGGITITPETKDSATQVKNVSDNILGLIRVIGTVIAVGVLMVIGIKYMMGSAEEKAEYKKTMIPYIIGAVILFAAVNIAAYVYNIANTFTT